MTRRTDEVVTADGVELHYSACGDPSDPPVVCVHGLSRVGRDFDPLAHELAEDYRVLCPDVQGRGLSERAPEGAAEEWYTGSRLTETLVGFFDELGIDTDCCTDLPVIARTGAEISGKRLQQSV